MEEPRSTRSSPSQKRPRNAAEESPRAAQAQTAMADLLKKRAPSQLIKSGQISSLQPSVHSDLRELNWTIMVGPAMTPKGLYSPKLLESNKLVVHVVAVDYDTKPAANEQEQEAEEQPVDGKGGVHIRGIFSLGFLGPADDVVHLATEQAVQDWRANYLSETAIDGQPRFVESMVNLDKRAKDKWNKYKGVLFV